MDNGETGVDCGGGGCPACRAFQNNYFHYHFHNQHYNYPQIIRNEIISYTLLFVAVCNNNGVMDNGETGVDCGGGGCPACRTFQNKYFSLSFS